MKIPRDLDGRELVKTLCKHWDYSIVNQVGSHVILQTETPGHQRISVPDHSPLRVGTLNAILRQVADHQRLSAKRSRSENIVVCRLKPLTTFALLLLAVMSLSAFAGVESPQFDPFDGPAILPIFLMMVAFGIGLFICGIGFACAVFAAGFAALLVAVGIVSSAVMIGALRRRVSSGVRAFHYMLSVAIAVPATVGALWLSRFFLPVKLSTAHICMLGTFSGIVGGLLFAHTLNVVARNAYRRFFSPTSTL